MAEILLPEDPFGKIALCCSGGGYRAASFHLGSMSYLHRIKYEAAVSLLEHVKMISTVSGGTIPGIVYALSKQKGETFEVFYRFMLQKLETIDLVATGISMLNPAGELQNKHKTKNLINAFAQQYDQHFTFGKTINDLNQNKTHLEALVFNSTEFDHAINFRFRNLKTGRSGNYYHPVPQQVIGEVKLSDVMASSSCFTGGFEPLLWPGDFVYDGAKNLLSYKETYGKNTGIMDGGIYDNQGIQSVLSYKNGKYFDLVVISDVTSPYMKKYEPLAEKAKNKWNSMTLQSLKQRLGKASKVLNFFFGSAMLTSGLLPLAWDYKNTAGTGICLTLCGVFGLLWLAKYHLVRFVRKKHDAILGEIKQKIGGFYVGKFKNLKIEEMSLHRLEPLIMDRLGSLLTLMLDVFLKIVRRMNYNKIYTDRNYTYRRMSNLIRELTEYDYTKGINREGKKNNEVRPKGIFTGNYADDVGPEIKKLTEETSKFGTTLWFTEDDTLNDMLRKLVATGQLTMCYNLIVHLEKIMFTPNNGYAQCDAAVRQRLEKMYAQCVADWDRFKNSPMVMVDDLDFKPAGEAIDP